MAIETEMFRLLFLCHGKGGFDGISYTTTYAIANTYLCTGVHEQNCLAFGIPGMQHELFKDS